MTVKTRIEPIEDWISLTVDETLSPAARSEAVADFARARRQDAQDANARILGRVPRHETFVDGRKGAPLESVDPDRGIVVVEFDVINDVLRWIGQALRDRSPVRSGKYREGHTLFADGVEVALGGNLPPADEFSFTNTVPYARKIELGTSKTGVVWLIQVEPRIYERAAKDARARFGNLAKIEFTYRGIVGGYQIKAGTRGTAHNRPQVRYPTIVVRPN